MSVRKALAWSVSGQMISLVFTLCGNVLVARILSPREIGIFAFALAVYSVLGIFSTLGVGSYLVREAELRKAKVQTAFAVNALVSLAISGCMLAGSDRVAAILGEPAVASILDVIAFAPIIAIFEFLPAAMLQREMQFKVIAGVNTARVVVSTTVSVVLAMSGFSYMSLAYSHIVATLFGAVVFNIVAPNHASIRVSLAEWRPILAFGINMLAITGVSSLCSRLSDILIGRILGLEALGYYSRAVGIANVLFENVYGAATRVVFVQLAREYRDTGTIRKSFLHSIEMLTSLMWPLLVGIAVLSPVVISNLFGDKWAAAAAPLSFVLLGQVIVLCFALHWELFVLKNETRTQTRLEFIRAGFGLCAIVFGTMFGLVGAALGRMMEALFGYALFRRHVVRLSQTQPREILEVHLRSAALTLVAVCPALVLMIATNWSPHTSLVLTSGAVGLGMLLWVGTLVWLDHPLLHEFGGAAAWLTRTFRTQ